MFPCRRNGNASTVSLRRLAQVRTEMLDTVATCEKEKKNGYGNVD